MVVESAKPWVWRALAAGLILAAAIVRIGYFAHDCPLDLAPDEAHYWDWSRHLDWSYYSKGPVVAYLIRAGCMAAGDWSQQTIGSEMIAVRLPALVCGSLLLLALYILAAQVYRSEGTGFLIVAVALTVPLISAGSSIMTIDAPFTCCWGWALVVCYQALFRDAKWAWPVVGLLVGCGILAKYTMALWLPSLALFLYVTPGFRRELTQPGLWLAAVVAALCCLPIIIWNAQHDWVSILHLGGHSGITSRSLIHWLGPLRYLGAQAGLLLGFWFVVWLMAMIVHAPGRETRPELLYLWWMSAPIFGVFLVFSLKNGGGEPNWPVTAYISGLVLATGWLGRQMRSSNRRIRFLTTAGAAATCVLGILLTAAVHNTRIVHPLLTRLVGPASATNPTPLRRIDPTCRLRGWRTLASALDRLREQVRRETKDEPILAGASWNLPGILGFYCAGRPTVYSFGLAAGDRHSQYDLWRPNPLDDPDDFRGRTFIVVGAHPRLETAFESVLPADPIVYREGEHAIAIWPVTICQGYRGFPARPASTRY